MPEHDPTSNPETHTESIFPNQEMTVDEVASADYQDRAASELEPTSGPGVPVSGYPAAQQAAQPPTAIPIPPPFPLPMRPVSGRYRSRTGGWELELRVDVDRVRPTKRVSGDFFQISGATKSYFGSFVVHTPTINVSPTLVTIEGLGQYTWSAGAPRVRVTIPRVRILQPSAPATLRFFTLSGSPGATYVCAFESIYFRKVEIETDRVSDVTSPVFATYNTGSLPSPGPARNLSVATAYAEAGIEVQISTASDVVDVTEAGAGASWSDAELHGAMVKHFSFWKDIPQFKVWEVVALNHDLGPGLLGIMFDQQGKHRQGCAVFHRGLGGTTAELLRLQLYTYVHELGHCFNLLHSWQKSLATPPGVDRPLARSWMNYPWKFPGGPTAFWNVFPFEFDDGEVVHLRHAFLNNIIMGGANFAVGSGVAAPEKFDLPLEDHSGLRLSISAPETFVLGEPVTIDLRLTATDSRAAIVHPYLQPEVGLVAIGILKPGGKLVAYDPLISHCVAGQKITLTPENDSIQETVYIGYGRDGLYFDQAGLYEVRAVYEALDGSRVVSNILKLKVRTPVSVEEGRLVDLMLGDEQGSLFYLRGSDSDFLRNGNAALDEVIDRYGDHALAAYARVVKGINLARDFKTITTEPIPKVVVRSKDQSESEKLMAAIATAESDRGRMAAGAESPQRAMRLANGRRQQREAREEGTAEVGGRRGRGGKSERA